MVFEKLMTQMLLSCKEATFLIEKKIVSQLTIKEKLRLKIHLKLCKICNAYQYQSKVISNAVEKWIKINDSSKALPSKVKLKILQKINLEN